MSMVIVENSGEYFASKFDGRTYEFKPGKEVSMTVEAARHIFGFGLANKEEVLSRHSWMMRSTEREAAMKRLGEFKFSVAEVKIVPQTPALETQEHEQAHSDPEESDASAYNGRSTAPPQPDAAGGRMASDGVGREPAASTNKRGLITESIFTS